MYQLALTIFFLLLGRGEAPSVPAAAPKPSPALPGPTAADLRKFDFVSEVAVHEASGPPAHRIIHVLNWHFVEREDFAADLRDTNPDLADEEIDDRYDDLIASVEAVQAERRQLLQHLTEKHGLRGVHLEGLSVELLPALQRHVKTLRDSCTSMGSSTNSCMPRTEPPTRRPTP